MSKALIVCGHPNLHQSTANQTIIETLRQTLGDTAHIRLLGELYPDSQINVAAEQAALLDADVVVWQFPFYWYSLPALMKKYLDDVYLHGFAYGSNGTALAGKKLIVSFTAGAPAAAYQYGEAMNYPVEDFLPPLRQSAVMCSMDWQPPVYSTDIMYVPGVSSEADREAVEHKARAHAGRLAAQIRTLINQEAAA
ncbi:NAD(P)H-dependent oxidoreductase [Uruburuella testudinis]|uniref:NAD(P)H-dependent oxidoreductase n=1 Tax=Uruburuella testudinis TaxID=1282863 RepID=A0ABY4DPV6_9NEIS|nr:NAD(P)H-dependent oxidoreductase [Uruburuella testudinis]UOO81070.1 NAD(P)H-dependent oxidoreductase [Uruburuella testudinis]